MSNGRRERFIAQFEWDGAEAIYRGNRTGIAYRVTIDEYHRFLDDYDRRGRLTLWTLALVSLLVLTAFLFAPPLSAFFSGQTRSLASPAAVAEFFASSWLADRWLLRAPARALRRRTPDAAALSGDARLARTIGERSWDSLVRDLALFGLMFSFLVLVVRVLGADLAGWVLVTGSFGAIALTLVQMLRKWAFDRRQSASAHVAGIAS